MTDTSSKQRPLLQCREALLVGAEVLARHVNWRVPWLQGSFRRLRQTGSRALQTARRDELRDRLREIGVAEGALVMAHTSVTDLRLVGGEADSIPTTFATTAKLLLDELRGLVGATGTLLMPTNAQYQMDDVRRTAAERDALVLSYDPQRTICAVGLVNEYFRRSRGVIRSLHPYNPLAAAGPLADELLRGNLHAGEPLPHGVDSAYYRFCLRNGVVLGLGVPLWHSMTVIHVPEDVRDAEWPIPGFFERRRYSIRIDGADETHIVRQRRPEFGTLSNCNRKVRRDLLREGILHEGRVGRMIVDWALSRDVLDYMMARNGRSAYPYYGVRLARWSAR